MDGAQVSMVNTTIAGSTDTALVARSGSTVTFLSSIIWSNGTGIIESGGTVTANYSCIQDGVLSGTGNIPSDPLFADAAGGDYSLQPGSPCIDTGDAASTDPDDTRTDMGAFHYNQVMNHAPVYVTTALPPATERQEYSIDVHASDPDPGTSLTYSLVTAPAWLVASNTTCDTVTLAGLPLENDTTVSVDVTVRVYDGIDSTDATFALAVRDTNYAPKFDTTASQLTTGYVGKAWSDILRAVDPDGNDRGHLVWDIISNGGLDQLFLVGDSTLVHPKFVAEDTLQTYTVVVRVVDPAGAADTASLMLRVVGSVGVLSIPLPSETTLFPNTPNPFNPTTSIRFTLADQGHVSLLVYNALGQQVRTLVNGHTTAGLHSVTWNGRDDNGKAVAGGVYLYRLIAGEKVIAKRMVMVR
jgi:hypothetical protein